MKKKNLCLRFKIFFIATLVSFPLLGLDQAVAQETKQNSLPEWENIVSNAEKEGKVSIYMSREGEFPKVVSVFNKKFPKIHVSLVTGGGHYAARILAERRARKYFADLVVTGPGTPYYVLYRRGLLDPIKPALILPEVTEPSNWWQGKQHYIDPEDKYVFVFMGPVSTGYVYYNTNQVKPSEFKSYYDLLKSKWKGKMIMRDPRTPGSGRSALRAIYHHPELGPKFLVRLFGEMDLTLVRDPRQLVDWLAVGKYPICVFCTDARYAKAQGLPVDEFRAVDWLKRPAIVPSGSSTMAMLNRAPHPNATTVFMNWLLSRQGQTTLQDVLNPTGTVYESMREDIPKDIIPAGRRRQKGVDYLMMATPTRADNEPVRKLLKQVIK